MKRRLFVAGLSAAPLIASLEASAQSANWQTIVGPELRFRFEMPAPVDKTTATEQEQGHVAPRIAWASKHNGQNFDLDFADYQTGWFTQRDSRVMAKELGRGDAEKAFTKDKYKYIRDEAVEQQGWDGYALDIEDPAGLWVVMRTYIVRDRLYRLLVTTTTDPQTRLDANRFLNSFKLAESRQ
jgi:hypothetical protein